MSASAKSSRALVSDILRLRHVLSAHRGLFLASVALIVGMQLCGAAVSALSAWTMARIAAEHLEGVALWIALLAISVAMLGVLTGLESWWSHVLAYRVLSTMRLAMHAAIGRIAPQGLAGRRTGEVAGAAIHDVEQLEWFYAHTAGASIAALISPSIVVSASTALVGPIGLIPTLGLLVVLVPLWFLGPVQARQGERVRSALSDLKADTLEGAQGLRDSLTLGATERRTRLIVERTRAVQNARLAFNMRSGAESALADCVMAAVNLALLALLGGAAREGAIDPVVVPVAVVLVFHAFAPVSGVYAMWQRLGEMGAAARRVDDVSRAPSPVRDDEASAEAFSGNGEIELVGVRAGYPGRDVLHGLDLRIPHGQMIALVGASGVGKTTLVHLLVRFADPSSGIVRIGGRDLRTVAADRVRDRVVLVPQTSSAMRASLRENLLLARPDASDEDLLRALEEAALGDLVEILDGGLDASLGEGGGTLSGGQLQRLALARALLLDPAVLVLDEPVAHLDALAESELNASLRATRRGRTTVVVAHRVSTIRAADRVVLIDGGRIVADGAHEALLTTSPEYRRIVSEEAASSPEDTADADAERR
ncbi:ABC transporter ATP-binding protein [Leucobacter luti]|uniref:ABC transporter ATP-binding protein n=1 Tax=Leucobacter luti TaxID=340320 RepID=UPI003D0663C3